jgi:DNA-binding MarR family transcriptional regulator
VALPPRRRDDPGPPLIGALLRIPWENVHQRLLAGLHDRGFTDLHAPHLSILLYPGPGGMRPSDLAAERRISKQALNYLLGQLERQGYLERRDDPDDQRSKRIELTPRGRQAARAMREIVHEIEADWARQLGPRRFAELRLLLTDLNHLLADAAPPG